MGIERRKLLEDAALLTGGAATGLVTLTACDDLFDQPQEEPVDPEAVERARQARIEAFIEEKRSLPEITRESAAWDDVGGDWIAPTLTGDGENPTIVRGDTLTIKIKTHDENDRVALTGNWSGKQSQDPQNPAAWYIFDVVRPNDDGFHQVTIDFKRLKIQPGTKIELGFDVVSQKHRGIKESPDGTRYMTRQSPLRGEQAVAQAFATPVSRAALLGRRIPR